MSDGHLWLRLKCESGSASDSLAVGGRKGGCGAVEQLSNGGPQAKRPQNASAGTRRE